MVDGVYRNDTPACCMTVRRSRLKSNYTKQLDIDGYTSRVHTASAPLMSAA